MPKKDKRPNIILILADDLGFSDIGCYGSEIKTPNLDRLAASGLRFSSMYNGSRCCPARASLLTGLHPHQAGVAHMTFDLGIPGYRGFLRPDCATVAETLRDEGYSTFMSGKWHVGGNYRALDRESWKRTAGDEHHPLPTQRGFDKFYGILNGVASFYDPVLLMDQDTFIRAEGPEYYLTDAVTDHAVEMISDSSGEDNPFFLYLSYTAPHWPLHAPEEEIARYENVYRKGWDAIRTDRHESLKGSKILDEKWPISPRAPDAPAWETTPEKEWEALRMAVFAAQIDRMDQGIGRVLDAVKENGDEENTLVMFLSDNGGCAEFMLEDPGDAGPSIWGDRTRDGKPMQIGNITGLRPGPEDTYMSYDLPWTNTSNAPFRLFKHWVHEGGISTPFIVSWPEKIKKAEIRHEPMQLVDITATVIDAASASYPSERNGAPVPACEGESFYDLFEGKQWSKQTPLFFEHEGNAAIREDRWKLVKEHNKAWELYDMALDRTELNDLASKNAGRVKEMADRYDRWAKRCGVLPWPPKANEMQLNMRGQHIHLHYHLGRDFLP
jgi:arylsulfatase A-like enzyme